MRRRIVAATLAILIGLAGVQVVSWQLHARHQLVRELPMAIRYAFIDANRRMHSYSRWPQQVNLVLSESIDQTLAEHPESFRDALKPARVEVQTEQQALRSGVLSNRRCQECVLVHYRESRNNPLYAEIEVSFSGGDHASGYRQTWIHVLGRWIHVSTRFVWIT